MKTMLLLTVALFTIPASQAFSQAECNQGYEVCMNSCMSKNSSQQGNCIVGCQDKNNLCSTRVYGRPPQDDASQTQVNSQVDSQVSNQASSQVSSDPEPSIAPVEDQSARDEAKLPARKKSRR